MFKAPIDFLHELWVQKPISIIGDKITWHLILQSLHCLQLHIIYSYIFSQEKKKSLIFFFISFLFKLCFYFFAAFHIMRNT